MQAINCYNAINCAESLNVSSFELVLLVGNKLGKIMFQCRTIGRKKTKCGLGCVWYGAKEVVCIEYIYPVCVCVCVCVYMCRE